MKFHINNTYFPGAIDVNEFPEGVIAPADAKVLVSSRVVANQDGKVRESRDKRVLTRHVTDRVKETEERMHLGDTTHDVSIFLLFLLIS